MKLNIYLVIARVVGGGEWVPLDPCAGGGYLTDKVHSHTITASSAALARAAIKTAYPTAVISVRLLGPAHVRGIAHG